MNKQFIIILLRKLLIKVHSASQYFWTTVSEQIYTAVLRRREHENYRVTFTIHQLCPMMNHYKKCYNNTFTGHPTLAVINMLHVMCLTLNHLANDGLQLSLQGNNLITSIVMILAIINKEGMLGARCGGLLCVYYAKLLRHVTGSILTCAYYAKPFNWCVPFLVCSFHHKFQTKNDMQRNTVKISLRTLFRVLSMENC